MKLSGMVLSESEGKLCYWEINHVIKGACILQDDTVSTFQVVGRWEMREGN